MRKKIFIIDNYDSFTYNLVHILNQLNDIPVTVRRNDELDFDEIEAHDYLVLSPGPGIPDEAGQLKEAIMRFSKTKKILGVCLGHQAIGECFGSPLQNLTRVYHGIQTNIIRTEVTCPLFDGISKEFVAGRYHSWVIEKDSLSQELEVSCRDEKNEIMAFKHIILPIYGLQFHPESILTPEGQRILLNFLNS